MEEQTVHRFVPQHPLPQEIQDMQKDDTVCKFCGVSYLIHNEMKALEERVRDAERQMEYYKGSVEREEKLKIKVASMEEESDKLSRALQASEDRTRILAAELITRQEEIEKLKQQKNTLEEKLQEKEKELRKARLKHQNFSRLIPTSLLLLQTQKTSLNGIKSIVANWNQDLLGICGRLIATVEGSCKKLTLDKEILQDDLGKAISEKDSEHQTLVQAQSLTEELKTKCSLLETSLNDLNNKMDKVKLQNNSFSNEASQYKEVIQMKDKELNDCKEKFQNAIKTSKHELNKTQEALALKEKEVRRLVENCRSLEKRVTEFSEARTAEEEKSANSLEEMKALKESLSRIRSEVEALKEEREMMVAAHHNRIEQLRASFKKKMEEAEAWPAKLDKVLKEKEAQFQEEKNNMWKELTDGFEKEMEAEQQNHQQELDSWKTEARAAQDNFRKDLTGLNTKHREEVRKLERALAETKEKGEQSISANNAVIQNLETKIVDLENKLRLPSVESTERVVKLASRLKDTEDLLQHAEAHIRELETKEEACRQEVAFLQETVRRECEERLELTDALAQARTQLLTFQRAPGTSFSRTSLSSSSPISPGGVNRAVRGELGTNDSSHPTACTVGFEGGVGQRPGSTARDLGRLSRAGSVDDSRQRIEAAIRRTGSKSRLGGNFSS